MIDIKQEKKVMNAIVKAWNEYLKLKILHPDDFKDFKFHIHAMQNIIMARSSKLK